MGETHTGGAYSAEAAFASEEQELSTPEELSERLAHFFEGYYLVGARRDRNSLYALSPEQLKAYPRCIYGLFVNLVMDGEMDRAQELLQMFDENHLYRLGMELVFPPITLGRFVQILDYMKEHQLIIHSILLTAGRPSVLNGLNDFSRFGPILEGRRDRIEGYLPLIYDQGVCSSIYNLALAEWYYQQNRLMDAGLLVGRTVKAFDVDNQRRFLFAALYLQSKIALANGNETSAGSYIKNIRRFVKLEGEQEFSYNLDAAEALAAMYDGRRTMLSGWLKDDAPDEFSDFNMLDLYRYMVKIRCYIMNGKYMAVVALAERLRYQLTEGKRYMDLCELDLLLAMNFYRSGEKQLALVALDRSLKIARRRGYLRLIADEGIAVIQLLVDYIKEKGETPFLVKLVEMARIMAESYPLYLQPLYDGGITFSSEELYVLKFLEQGMTKEDIADFLFITVNGVNYHLKKIYAKLGVSAIHQAVWQARSRGII